MLVVFVVRIVIFSFRTKIKLESHKKIFENKDTLVVGYFLGLFLHPPIF